MTALTWDIKAEFSAGNWTSIKADSRTIQPVSWTGGTNSADPSGVRCASPGSLTFALDNSIANSGGLMGYYSPGHTNCRAGWGKGTRVRVQLTTGATTKYWMYKVIDAIPITGIYRDRYVAVTCDDYIGTMASRRIERIAVQIDATSDQLYQAIIDNLPAQPENTDFDTGADSFKYAFAGLKDERSTALNAAYKVALSGLEYLYLTGDTTDGETLVSENRHTRLQRDTSEATFSNTMTELTHRPSTIYNVITCTAHPAAVDELYDTVLATLQREVTIPAGATLEPMVFRYSDPSGGGARISGIDMQTPVVNYDYKMSSKSGRPSIDLNADLSLTVTFGGNSAEVTPENTGASTGYWWYLRLRGRGVYLYDPVERSASDATSITDYGVFELPLDLPYQDDPNVAQDFADWILSLYKDPQAPDELESLTFIANRSSTFMGYGCLLDVGSRVTVAETVGGSNNDFFVNRITREITGGNILTVTLSALEMAQSIGTWMILNTGVLNTNTLGV